MDYRMFPFDKQICPIVIESYAYRDYQLQLNWRDEDPIQYNSNLQLAEFKLGIVLYVCMKKVIFFSFNCTVQETKWYEMSAQDRMSLVISAAWRDFSF